MVESECGVDEKYKAEGWTAFSTGWPDRACFRMTDGKLEVRLVEIKSPTDSVNLNQALMQELLRSQGLDVQIDPPSKSSDIPSWKLRKMLEILATPED
jgi:hypothetical protein